MPDEAKSLNEKDDKQTLEEPKFEELKLFKSTDSAEPQFEGLFGPEPEQNLAQTDLTNDPFQIDYTNRKIRTRPGVRIANSNTRKFLKLSPDFLLSGVLEADATVTTVLGTAGETTLNSYTIPLNSISRNYAGAATGMGPRDYRKAGNVFRIWGAGTFTADDAVATVTLKLKVGSTTYHTIVSTGAIITNGAWLVDWRIIIPTIGASGTAESFAEAEMGLLLKTSDSTATQTIDTTANQVVSITATWTNGDAADNIKIRQFIVEILN